MLYAKAGKRWYPESYNHSWIETTLASDSSPPSRRSQDGIDVTAHATGVSSDGLRFSATLLERSQGSQVCASRYWTLARRLAL